MQTAVAYKQATTAQTRQHSIPESSSWFTIVPADSPELRDCAYMLRYQVYCVERGYEASEAYPDFRETDQYDTNAVHSLLVSNHDNALIGTVRLVLANRANLQESFPIQHVCALSNLPHSRSFPLERTAEISRFALSKSGRTVPARFQASSDARSRKTGGHLAISAPSILLGLMRATMRMSHDNGITDWLAVMEPTLLRLLARFGIYFQPIGPLVDYHGMRQPCHANIQLLLERMSEERPDVWDYITDGGLFAGGR